jgi:hypothetical protein
MTSGAGIAHSEMPSEDIMTNGGTLEGLQLWVNLPRADKMIKPKYQEKKSSEIPELTLEEGVKVRVIAGSSHGTDAIITTHSPIMYMHYTLEKSKKASQTIPADFVAFAYVLRGAGTFGPNKQETKEGQMAVYAVDTSEGEAEFEATSDETLSFVLIGGKPLNEPVVRKRFFVMNTQEEIDQAFEDWESGKMGQIQHD